MIEPKRVKKCKKCGSDFSPRNTIQKYCSHKCAKEAEPQKYGYLQRQSKPPTRNKVAKTRRNTGDPAQLKASKTKIRQAMLDSPGYLHCQWDQCTTPQNRWFEFHHIIYRSEAPGHPKLHSAKNLIHVCKTCHEKLHNQKRLRAGLVTDRGLDKIFGKSVRACEH